MPLYNYYCDDCKENFEFPHKVSEKLESCKICGSNKIKMTLTNFSSRTETGVDAQNRRMEKILEDDKKRLKKDDNFAANITGQFDTESEARKEKILNDLEKKNKEIGRAHV